MEMTLGQLNGFLAATVRSDLDAMARAALAARVAQADEKNWKRAMKEWGHGE